MTHWAQSLRLCTGSVGRTLLGATMQRIATVRARPSVWSAHAAARGLFVTAPHPIDQDIRQARVHPAVRAIVIPPCPESLLRLQQIVAAPELDSTALEQLASSDVALAAAVMRLANSPL